MPLLSQNDWSSFSMPTKNVYFMQEQQMINPQSPYLKDFFPVIYLTKSAFTKV